MIFSGTGVALATPLGGGEILFGEVDKLLSLTIGVDALVALGTTGEAATMNETQKEQFVRYVRSKSTLPLIVGTGGNNTEAVVANSLKAKSWGADGLLVVTPFYNKCTQEGAFLHYKRIAESARLPIIVYNVPARTGFNLLPETMARIAALPNIEGVKEASGNMEQIMECIRLVEYVYSGDDALTVPAMCMGAKGVISVAANVAPALISRMTSLCKTGNFTKAGALQLRILPLIKALFSEVNPIPVRAALKLLGIDMGEPRLPMTEISDGHKAQLINAMEDLKLI